MNEPAESNGTSSLVPSNSPREQRALVADQARDPLLDPARRDEVVDVDGLRLPEPEDPADPLLEHRGVPRHLEVDAAARGALEVQPDTTGIRREQHARRGIVVKRDEVLRAPAL